MTFDPVGKIIGKKINIDLKSKNKKQEDENEDDNDDYGMKYARPSSQPFVCSSCGYQTHSRGELFEHKKMMHGRP